MEQDKIDRLIKSGGKRWKEYGYDRIYFNQLAKIIKLETNIINHPRYHQTLNGEAISTKKAITLHEMCKRGKFWYDVKKEKFGSTNIEKDVKLMLIDAVNFDNNEFTEILSEFDDI